MYFLTFRTKILGQIINLDFSKKAVLVLNGMNSDDIIYRIECLLYNDYTSYYLKYDNTLGFNYSVFDEDSVLYFNNGSHIIGTASKRIITTKNTLPKLHCIRYLQKGEIRSFITTDSDITGKKSIDYDTTVYSSDISQNIWFRIIETTNQYLGKKFVELKDNKLYFDFSENDFSKEAQKFVYLLISECYLIPKDYKRVLLLSNIELLNNSQQVRLLELLGNFSSHDICISSARINISDCSDNTNISFLNI